MNNLWTTTMDSWKDKDTVYHLGDGTLTMHAIEDDWNVDATTNAPPDYVAEYIVSNQKKMLELEAEIKKMQLQMSKIIGILVKMKEEKEKSE